MVNFGSKKTTWQWPSYQTKGFITLAHKPMGDVTVGLHLRLCCFTLHSLQLRVGKRPKNPMKRLNEQFEEPDLRNIPLPLNRTF